MYRSHTRKKLLLPLLLSLVALLALPYAFAQETTAGMEGLVKDPSGAVVAKATVEITSPSLIGVKRLETDASGYYRFTNLPPGTYTLTVNAPGFRTYKQAAINLFTGRMPTIDVSLQVGAAAETVEVTGKAPLVDVTQSKTAVIVALEILNQIPKGRSFQSVIPFAPGARQEPLQSTARSVLSQGGAGRSGGFQIDGSSDSENTYMVEGMDTTDIQNGGTGTNVPMEFIQDVQVKSAGFEAEYGGGSGVVNVIQKRGSNAWHGSVFASYRSDALNANDDCLVYTFCGLRTDPTKAFSSSRRTDASLDTLRAKPDHYRLLDPGFEVGGPILTNKLWLFTSYAPNFTRLKRTTTFTSSDPVTGTGFGVRSFNEAQDVHNALTRLDFAATHKIRLYAAWQYGYARLMGINLPEPDPISPAQANATAGTDPRQYNPDRGTVNPNSVYTFGGDISVTSKLVITARYGYWYTNSEDRGVTVGNPRFLWVGGGSKGIAGVPVAWQQNSGFQTIPANTIRNFDINKRQGFNADASYSTKFAGAHTFKVGYGFNKLANNVNTGFAGTYVRLFWGQDYSPLNPNACGVAGAPPCRGTYGYYIVRDGVDTIGNVSSLNHALYVQDAWTVGHGITLNLGVRFDKEHIPGFVANAPAVDFGWTQKVAPRLGGAWDVFRNGKMKLWASYGQFYDIMKYSLPQGSFGGQYWHDCAYTLDDPEVSRIKPVNAGVGTHFCPDSGGATGTTTGTFLENVNYRSVILDPRDPGVDPNLHPLKQHEFTVGAEYVLRPTIGLSVRYTRKRLDYAIEDVGVGVFNASGSNELYYIGNPGFGIVGNLLQRQTIDSSNPFTPPQIYAPSCADCPLAPKAVRNYDGIEFRAEKRASKRWFGSASYTYSRLWGNYGGLTSTEIADGSGGRHGPNNSRYFDLPSMAWDAHGHPSLGLLPTDRPHTLKLFGSYTLKWLRQETILGFSQMAFSGTPLSTCWPSASSTQSACEYVEGHGGWVYLTQAPATAAPGNPILLDHIQPDRRTPAYTQTDFNLHHQFHVSKQNEAMMLGFELNVFNLFNQRAVTALYDLPFGGSQRSTPLTAAGNIDWHALTDKGWDYVAVANTQSRALDSRYGQPALYQGARTIRLGVRFSF